MAFFATAGLIGHGDFIAAFLLTTAIIVIETLRLMLSDIFAAFGRVSASVATMHYIRSTMVLPVVGEWPGWPLLFGVLVLFGGFVSVMTGMLYKIAPFLIWLHLQNAGQGKVMAPNMKKIIEEAAMTRQMRAHFASCLLLFLAVFWPEWLVYPAGLALFGAQVWLGTNLIRAMKVYRAHLRRLQKLAHAQHHAEISA